MLHYKITFKDPSVCFRRSVSHHKSGAAIKLDQLHSDSKFSLQTELTLDGVTTCFLLGTLFLAMKAIRAEGVIDFEEVTVFSRLVVVDLLGGRLGVGLLGFGRHGVGWDVVVVRKRYFLLEKSGVL
jgi:hypothetical protein